MSEADDPFGGRTPTSHERMSGRPWDASYWDGPAPWDFGGPQPAVVRLADAGGFAGTVLDAGCGSGENTLVIASLGLPVLGVDVAETGLKLAREKAAERGIAAEFATADALHLERLERRFDTVLDSGLFHTFNTDERQTYAASLAAATQYDGTLYVLCFSNEGPDAGPHPVSQEDLRMAFAPSSGWTITSIVPERVRTAFHNETGAPAWLATITRTDPKELVRRGYDVLSLRYDEATGADSKYRTWIDELLARLASGSRVLDVGCGSGVPVARELAAAGHHVTGVDISEVQIRRARELVPDGEFINTDATSLDFPAESFDAVVSLYALIHLPQDEQQQLLHKIATWLRPGGWFLCTTGQHAWTGVDEDWLDGGAPMWWSHTDADTNRTWIAQAGLTIEHQDFVPEGSGGHALFWSRRPQQP